ncbi:MAG: RNA polymerase sigma factor [Mucilaginibacter sp.]
METEKQLIPHLFRTEYSKIVAVLGRLFGFEHIEVAEDLVSDTFMLAAESWGQKGIPANPVAWLYTVAKNKAKDHLKRNTIFNDKVTVAIQNNAEEVYETDIDLSGKNIADSQLQMMFAICNPVIPAEAQIGLSLRILCGFGIEEIADAFLTNKETINKRLFRAKEKLRDEKVKIEFPTTAALSDRLNTVLTTLYLLFNEGYYSQSQNTALRKDLCLEAMRLTYLLTENTSTAQPAVHALLALMCFHASRFEARTGPQGESILYGEQDTSLWDKELITRGQQYLNKASVGAHITKYHVEAAIAYWHTQKVDSQEKWDSILQLYNTLLILEYSPIAALNRTYALSKAVGKEKAIIEAEKLGLDDNHLYHCLLGYLYTDIDNIFALDHFNKALKLAKTKGDKAQIRQYIKQLTNEMAQTN